VTRIGKIDAINPSRSLGGCSLAILNGVLGCLNGACSDDLSRWLRFEHGRLFCKGIDPLTFFRRGLLDDDEFCKAGKQKGTAFLQLVVAHGYERFEDAFDVLLAQSFMFGGDFSIN
jgi:hypothetical protein